MLSSGNKLFEREDEIELWRSIGIKPHIIIDISFYGFVAGIADHLQGWMIAARRKGLKHSIMADRLNAAGLIAAPGHLWDGDSVQRALEIDHARRGPPAPLVEPRKRKRRRLRYARDRPPRQIDPKDRTSNEWFEQMIDPDTISSPYFRRKLERLRRERDPIE
jgi:hypothetical protein